MAASDLLKYGFSHLKLPKSVHEEMTLMVDLARSFFVLEPAAKNVATLPQQCGYRPMGIEYSISADRPDLIESFTYSPRVAGEAVILRDEAAALWRVMGGVFNFMSDLATRTFKSLDHHFGGDFSERDEDLFSEWSRLQINFSRPAQNAESDIHECHEDGDFFTIATASGPGLQLDLPNGCVVDGPPTLDLVIFMPGEILHLMSGGEIRPGYHRVISRPELKERVAVMFFGDLAPRFCQPWRRGDVNDGVDIGQVVVTSVKKFGLNGFTSP